MIASMTIRDLDFAFAANKPVFRGFNLELSGENPVVILGPSGCGKTTLLRLIAGLIRPQVGEISWKNSHTEAQRHGGTEGSARSADSDSLPKTPNIKKESGRMREDSGQRNDPRASVPPCLRENPAGDILREKYLPVSFIFQEPRLLPWKTALENVSLPLLETFGQKAAEEQARHFLALVSLEDKAQALSAELSGGQQQRVNLARAFACPAEILLMDEPFQSLDIPLRIALMDLTLSLLEEKPRLAVAVSHDPREAVYLGRRVIILGESPRGVIHDEILNLSPEKRRYGSPDQGAFERRFLSFFVN